MTTRSSRHPLRARQALLLSAMLGLAVPSAVATPEKSAKYYEDALARFEKNDITGAALQLKNALTENPRNLPAQLLYARLLHQAGEYKAAEAAYEAALKQAGVKHQAHFYPGTQHGFNNDTTPRFDEKAAALAWSRTIAFFRRTLAG